MPATAADAIIASLRTSQALLRRAVDGLTPDEFAHQPVPGANSAAWIVGHLALVERRILGLFGAADLPPVPDGFEARFTATRQAATEQKGLGDPKQLVGLFDGHRELLIAAVRQAPPEVLDRPLAEPRPLFKTVGEAALFMGVHVALHAGQITTIRRSLGHPPAA